MDSFDKMQYTTGELLAKLRQQYQPDTKDLAKAMGVSYPTYLNTERGKRELSFLMALKICRYYKLDLHEFVSMLSDDELQRKDLSITKAQQQRERKKLKTCRQKVQLTRQFKLRRNASKQGA